MNDFLSKDEQICFAKLVKMSPAVEQPLCAMDCFSLMESAMAMFGELQNYNELKARINKTFNPEATAPGGGDELFEIE